MAAASKRLLQGIRSNVGTGHPRFGFYVFADSFGTDRDAAAQRLAELYPRMKAEVPEFAPHLLAEVVAFQTETNVPIIAEFEKSLNECVQHPETLHEPLRYFNENLFDVYNWAVKKRFFEFCARTYEAKRRVATANSKYAYFDSEDMIRLSSVYYELARWQDCMELLEQLPQRPLLMTTDGLWGRGFTPVFPMHAVAACREKLGLPQIRDPRENRLSVTRISLPEPAAFAVEEDGIWIATADRLLRLNSGLETNFVVRLPKDYSPPISDLCVRNNTIWIATQGAGLIEYDQATRQCRNFTEQDGLFMNYITRIKLTPDTLWIGYGDGGHGGLGRMDLATYRLTSFTQPLTPDGGVARQLPGNVYSEPTNLATRCSILDLAVGSDGEVWLTVNALDPLRRYRSSDNSWEAVGLYHSKGCGRLAMVNGRLFVADPTAAPQLNQNGLVLLGVSTLNFKDGQWSALSGTDNLSPRTVSAITADGDDLWVGGMGYIALVRPEKNEVRKYAYVGVRKIEGIQIGGGYVWVNGNQRLYRAKLADFR